MIGGQTGQLHLPQSLRQPPFPKLPRIHQPLLRQINVLHIRRIRGRRSADPRCNENRVRFEDDAVVDDLVNGQRDEVVVLDDSAFVGCSSDSSSAQLQGRQGIEARPGRDMGTYLNKIPNASRNDKTTLYNRISFSSAPPTTYSITSLSTLNTTLRLSYRITSLVCLLVFSSSPDSNDFCSLTVG